MRNGTFLIISRTWHLSPQQLSQLQQCQQTECGLKREMVVVIVAGILITAGALAAVAIWMLPRRGEIWDPMATTEVVLPYISYDPRLRKTGDEPEGHTSPTSSTVPVSRRGGSCWQRLFFNSRSVVPEDDGGIELGVLPAPSERAEKIAESQPMLPSQSMVVSGSGEAPAFDDVFFNDSEAMVCGSTSSFAGPTAQPADISLEAKSMLIASVRSTSRKARTLAKARHHWISFAHRLGAEIPTAEPVVPVQVSPAEKRSSKFEKDVPCLRGGEPGSAATGLKEFMNVPKEKMQAYHVDPLQALRDEWGTHLKESAGKEEADQVEAHKRKALKCQGLLTYILDESAQEIEEESNDGHSTVVRDVGNDGKNLLDFVNMEQALLAKLSLAEVAALRIYTSLLFIFINPPFRNPACRNGFMEPHPLAITVLLISDGLKKLRNLHAGDNALCVFWRGMKNLIVPPEFERQGGTELQCMSTTADVNIAGMYGQSESPLVFCVLCRTFMTRGADISWLSLYGHEKEILYPPLTYLKFVGKRPIKNSRGTVIYVEPTMG